MNAELKNAVKEWLEAIMPSVVEMIAEVLTSEQLSECAKDPAIHGPYSIDIDEYEGPITAINFYVMVINQVVLLGVAPSIRDLEDNTPKTEFDMVFTIDNFAETVVDKEHQAAIVSHLVSQLEEVCE